MTETPIPRIGIIGAAGAYGRWLTTFFATRMGLPVIGHDPTLPDSPSARALRDASDVLLFAVPIRHTAAIIDALAADMPERANVPLWIDVTSIKEAPVAAMLRAPVEVLGLHPMAAPPKAPTLKGRVMVVCPARLQRWQPFVDRLLTALEAQTVLAEPAQHDAVVARVQALIHAALLSTARVLREGEAGLAPPASLLPYRSPTFELVNAMMCRVLAGNPAIYEDIQFGNPHVPALLDALAISTRTLASTVAAGDDNARAAFRSDFLADNRQAFGAAPLQAGNRAFEHLGYLLGDLSSPRYLSVHLPDDRPGALRAVLVAFEQRQLNIDSIHSSRTPEGLVQFRIGFSPEVPTADIVAAAAALESNGIALVVERAV